MSDACEILLKSRPTAINLFWAVERMKSLIKDNQGLTSKEIADILIMEAHKIRWKILKLTVLWVV